jgi:hypothetical protein
MRGVSAVLEVCFFPAGRYDWQSWGLFCVFVSFFIRVFFHLFSLSSASVADVCYGLNSKSPAFILARVDAKFQRGSGRVIFISTFTRLLALLRIVFFLFFVFLCRHVQIHADCCARFLVVPPALRFSHFSNQFLRECIHI